MLKIKHLMFAVLLFSIVFSSIEMFSRYVRYKERYEYHAAKEVGFRKLYKYATQEIYVERDGSLVKADVRTSFSAVLPYMNLTNVPIGQEEKRQMEYHRYMKERYRSAMRHPWRNE